MLKKWTYTTVILFFLITLYWFDVVSNIINQGRLMDLILFCVLGLLGGSVGFAAAVLANRVLHNSFQSLWKFLAVSVPFSLLVVYVASSIITSIVTVT